MLPQRDSSAYPGTIDLHQSAVRPCLVERGYLARGATLPGEADMAAEYRMAKISCAAVCP